MGDTSKRCGYRQGVVVWEGRGKDGVQAREQGMGTGKGGGGGGGRGKGWGLEGKGRANSGKI